MTWTSPATALDLQFSLLDDGENPSFDPDGSVLMSMASVVGEYYEDIIKDDWTIPITVRWSANLGALGRAGVSLTNVDTQFGTKRRANNASLFFSSTGTWYVDPDPSDHSEFELEQVLYRDLPSNSQDIGFPDGAPDLLEEGYPGLGSTGGFDLLSTVFHEVGHVLGVISGPETIDGDYDFLPHQIGGDSVSRWAVVSGGGHLGNIGGRSLMGSGSEFNRRRLPSAVDILAMAAASGWGDIDLPRKELLAGPGWNTGLNWLGGKVPDSDDEVTVRIGSSVTLSGAAQGHSLRIAEGTNLNTSGRNLTIGSGGLQVVDNAKLLVTGDSSVSVGGAVQIENGTLALDIDSNGANKVLADEFILDSGILELNVAPSLLSTLTIGERFPILETHSEAFGSVIGNFDQIVLTGATFQDLYNLGMALAVDYVDASIVGGIRLSSGVAVEVAIPGDYNLSGMVEGGDLNLVLGNWGSTTATWAEGDVDGDGFVGLADYNAVLAFWGTTSGGGGSLAAVPEPATFVLTTFALLGLIGYARRK